MTNVGTGRQAEAAAADYLERLGYTIVEQNWRTRQCEVDIIAERQHVLYFCEVKYRHSESQGSGLDYITPKKLRQMQFAAQSWVHWRGWAGGYQLCAIEVSGPSFDITAFIEDV